MPAGNGTGPMGMGPMTGRGAGYCAGSSAPGYTYGCGFGRGRGFGAGFGGGFGGGRRNRFFAGGPAGYAAPGANTDPALERQALANQAEALQAQLDAIRKRLSEME